MGREDREFCVYKHTSPVGKVYIGMTANPTRRFSRNGNPYKGCAAFYSAIRKYGWDNFKTEIIADGLTVEQAEKLEAEHIALHRSTEKKYGYNILAYGNVSQNGISDEMREKMSKTRTGRKGAVWTDEMRKALSDKKKGIKGVSPSEETRKKISEANKGRVVSEETRRKISESQKGKWHHTEEQLEKMREAWKIRKEAGWEHTEETKKKMSEAHKRAWERKRSQKGDASGAL